MSTELTITQLPDSADKRGMSFSLPEEVIGDLAIKDVHVAAIHPGHIRGNHYHAKKSEIITVVYKDSWSLHWDTGLGTSVRSRKFQGRGAVSIHVPLLWSHAVKNDGSEDLWLFNVTDMSFDRSLPGSDQDALARKVVSNN
jgi:oxalate decarboxylase/phosphoglucose isomerase-like protein (cupin superfamily)